MREKGGRKKAQGNGTKRARTSKAATPSGEPAARPLARTRARKSRPSAPESPSRRVALAVAAAALDKKAVNVEIIDVVGKVDYADYVVVMSGTSDRHVSALARAIAEDVEQRAKQRCLGVEGLPGGAWVLMDFGDVVVHVFHRDVRGYYDLESLWVDAARLPVPGAASESA